MRMFRLKAVRCTPSTMNRTSLPAGIISAFWNSGTPILKIYRAWCSSVMRTAALTPPKIKRGLVLTDPSYEDADEYAKAADTLCAVHEKWSAGILALWYPLLAHRKIECGIMKQKITASVRTSAEPCEILDAQLLVNTEDSHKETSLENASGSLSPRLYGSGMLIVNMPWKLDEELRAVLPYLAEKLGTDGRGSSSVTVC